MDPFSTANRKHLKVLLSALTEAKSGPPGMFIQFWTWWANRWPPGPERDKGKKELWELLWELRHLLEE